MVKSEKRWKNAQKIKPILHASPNFVILHTNLAQMTSFFQLLLSLLHHTKTAFFSYLL